MFDLNHSNEMMALGASSASQKQGEGAQRL